ncbi:beta-1,4-N-acetylgalactosaminyltransferase 3-like [Megalops cyprinoides]|uniref:beta-1,4-N-acetylgalactosaminyltransferase 3-like n=1 Tax=Megalops cyprinoides TaxID=118141 RepID=UPI001864CA64|nr:beta-1,4-N-acetylgalactosaminyltransferase 3-like [Megalops cyprinoides]
MYYCASRPSGPLTTSPSADGESGSWRARFTQQPWRPEYKGQANLHIFEDWCGSSTLHLRKNLHYPLYPHSRTTVKKLAVAPRWTNYGLRIFGYLHPYMDGEYLFAVASDDNSEFWLSLDDSPLNLRLLALLGKTGAEWAAPGEFGKYASQTSQPVQLSSKKRYYFEVIHKQNDRGTDHVEVAWRLVHDSHRFTVVGSKYISLYTNESALTMSEVSHIPQTAASHAEPLRESPGTPPHGADMLKADPRDTSYRIPLVDEATLRNVLPDCAYKPSYTIKGVPLLRYQGLQFVHMSYIYPNDYTRLTHMENDNKCFYQENQLYIDRFGFFKYMKMDAPENQAFDRDGRSWNKQDVGLKENMSFDEIFQYEDSVKEPKPVKGEGETTRRSNGLPDYGDDYDDYTFKRKRKLFAVDLTSRTRSKRKKAKANEPDHQALLEQQPDARQKEDPPITVQSSEKPSTGKRADPIAGSKLVEPRLLYQERNSSGPVGAMKSKGAPGRNTSRSERPLVAVAEEATLEKPNGFQNATLHSIATPAPMPLRKLKVPVLQGDRLKLHSGAKITTPQVGKKATTAKRSHWTAKWEQGLQGNKVKVRVAPKADVTPTARSMGGVEEPWGADALPTIAPEAGGDALWPLEENSEDDEDSQGADEVTNPPVFDQAVNWEQTFDVEPLDFHALRSDWIDLNCNVSGNLQLSPADAVAVVEGFVRKLHQKHPGRFSLLRVLNVEKRLDGSQGSRYLLELELRELGGAGGRVRLSHYIYALQRHGSSRPVGLQVHRKAPWEQAVPQEPLLCNPLGFSWNPSATVHFIVPVKNQARWVKQFIVDMEQLYKDTGDRNFNIIITDYSSTDMDVEQALRTSALPRYQYVKLSGNFERSAGLQAGIDRIADDHSIVFLCDLHIHFPMSIIDSIRKHCVEGKMAFAPIVMRLNCGATPQEPNGFWEVNGFGLLGIYKSDLDAAGGMNTKDFKDRWGGEDWELLDRILQAGLEVERIHLRNFMHHYHSKRGMWNRQSLKST